MKVGDILICKIKGLNHSKFIITKINEEDINNFLVALSLELNTKITLSNNPPFGFYIWDIFYSQKELRKLKLEQLNEI